MQATASLVAAVSRQRKGGRISLISSQGPERERRPMYAEDIAHGSSGVAFGTDGAKDSSFEHVGVIRERVGTYPSDTHAAAIDQRVGSR